MTASVAEIELPTTEFALSETFESLPGLSCEIERIVAHDTDRLMPFVWLTGGDYGTEEVTSALEADPSTDEVELLTRVDGEWLYRMAWVEHVQALVRALIEENGTVLAASREDSEWFFRLLFPDHDALSRTSDHCREQGLRLDIKRIYRLDNGKQGRFGLTDKQQDSLAAAFEHGYYEIPRGISAQGLATERGISHQALSEQLRRAHGSLVENTLITGGSTE